MMTTPQSISDVTVIIQQRALSVFDFNLVIIDHFLENKKTDLQLLLPLFVVWFIALNIFITK